MTGSLLLKMTRKGSSHNLGNIIKYRKKFFRIFLTFQLEDLGFFLYFLLFLQDFLKSLFCPALLGFQTHLSDCLANLSDLTISLKKKQRRKIEKFFIQKIFFENFVENFGGKNLPKKNLSLFLPFGRFKKFCSDFRLEWLNLIN